MQALKLESIDSSGISLVNKQFLLEDEETDRHFDKLEESRNFL